MDDDKAEIEHSSLPLRELDSHLSEASTLLIGHWRPGVPWLNAEPPFLQSDLPTLFLAYDDREQAK